MSYTERLRALQGSAFADTPAAGLPTKIWAADVTAINEDGTVNVQPVNSRAAKINVPVHAQYSPTVGDRVLVSNLWGDKQYPIVLAALTAQTKLVATFNGRAPDSSGNITPQVGDYAGTIITTGVYKTPAVTLNFAASTWTRLTALAVGFTAPPSGNVWVRLFGGQLQNNGPQETWSGIGVSGTASTPVVSENLGFIGNTSSESEFGVPYQFEGQLTGLTAGSAYTLYPWIYTNSTNGILLVDGTSLTGAGQFTTKITAL